MRNLTVFALSIGTINIQTGMNGHKWSIYENNPEDSELYLTSTNRLMFACKGTLQIGDSLTVRNNDSNRMLDTCYVVDILPTNKEAMIEKLLEHKFDYRILRAFSKKMFKNKLNTGYSIKGVVSAS